MGSTVRELISTFHDRGDLCKDYLYNSTLAHKFWLSSIKEYVPISQGGSKWRLTRDNLQPGQLVFVGDADDIKKGAHIVWGEFIVCTLSYEMAKKLFEGPL